MQELSFCYYNFNNYFDSKPSKLFNFSLNCYFFFFYSWHEIGTIDLPAMIDYVTAVTEEPKMMYVGHSQGSTVFLVMNSLMPWYNDRFTAFFALSPIAYNNNMFSPIFKFLSHFTQQIDVRLRYS